MLTHNKHLKRFCKECGNVTNMSIQPIVYTNNPGLIGSIFGLTALSIFLILALVLRP